MKINQPIKLDKFEENQKTIIEDINRNFKTIWLIFSEILEQIKSISKIKIVDNNDGYITIQYKGKSYKLKVEV